MEKLQLYLKESYEELKTHVTWPTWKELQLSATVVGVAAVIIALVIFAMDMSAKFAISDIIYKFLNK